MFEDIVRFNPVTDGRQRGQGCKVPFCMEPVTPVDGEVKLSWTESLNWPMPLATITRWTVVPFRKVVALVIWVQLDDDWRGSPILTVKEKSGPRVPLPPWKNRKKDATPPTIIAVIIIAAMSFFRLFFGLFFGVILGRVFAKSRFHFSPFSFNH